MHFLYHYMFAFMEDKPFCKRVYCRCLRKTSSINKTRHVIREESKGDTDNEGTELGITLEDEKKKHCSSGDRKVMRYQWGEEF